jgi:hypothetical protein
MPYEGCFESFRNPYCGIVDGIVDTTLGFGAQNERRGY